MHPSRPATRAILALLIASLPSQALTLHFDSRLGSDDADGLTPATARRSLAPLRNLVLQPGDSLLLQRGSVWTADSLMLRGHGTLEQPWVLGSYGDPALPVPSVSNPGFVVVIRQASHLVVQDLELSGARGGCVELADSTVSHAVIQRLDLHHCGGGIYVTGHDVTVVDSRIHDGKMVVNTPQKDDDYGATGVGLSRVDGCRVQRNRFWNLIAPSMDYGVDGGAVEIWKTVRHCDVSRNVAIGCDGFVEFGGQKGDSVVDFALHHNVSFASKVLACLHFSDTNALFGIGYDAVRFDHNLVVDRFQPKWGYHVVADGGRSADPGRVKFRQNIWVTDSANLVYYQQSGSKEPSWEHAANLAWNRQHDPFKLDRVAGPGEVFADPRFRGPWATGTVDDTVLAHYGLVPESPARGAGSDLGYVEDFFGTPYAPGAKTDLGPFAPGTFDPGQASPAHSGRPFCVRIQGGRVVVAGLPRSVAAIRLDLASASGRKLSSMRRASPVGEALEIDGDLGAYRGVALVRAWMEFPDGTVRSVATTLAVP